MSFIVDQNFGVEYTVAHTGYLSGKPAQLVSLFGYRTQWSSTSVQGDVCPYLVGGQAAMNTPTSGQTLYIVSTSVEDVTGGTGVDRLRVTYLNASGNQQVTIYNLNGLTAVSIGSGFTFIQYMESYHSVTAERVAAGNLTISSTNGVALESTTFEMIRSNANRSESARYKVPTGKHIHLIDWHASAIKQGASQTYEVALRSTLLAGDGLANNYHFVDTSAIVDGGDHDETLHYKEIPTGGIIKASVVPSATASGNIVRIGIDFILMDD